MTAEIVVDANAGLNRWVPYTREDYPEDCRFVNIEGGEYVDFSCMFSWLRPTYTKFEVGYAPQDVGLFMLANPWIPMLACASYAAFIYYGQKFFKDRPAWNLRGIMAMWNLGLSLFSWIGMMRTVPQLVFNMSSMSVRDNLCLDMTEILGCGSTGLWIQLFVLSKIPELIDTFFIVVHKKQLIFLHWYHHITVLLYSWHAYISRAPYSFFFVTMNFSVHAIMYGYYFLMAVGRKPKWLNPMFITAAQISQMIVGVTLSVMAFYYYFTENDANNPCMIRRENLASAVMMYGSYLYLFVEFFLGRFDPLGKKQQSVKVEKKAA